MYNNRREKDSKYGVTSLKLIGFILCFVLAFFSFTIADEGPYFIPIVFSGFALLICTFLIFCGVMKDTVYVYTDESYAFELQPFLRQEEPDKAEPELPPEPQQAPQQEPCCGAQDNLGFNDERNNLALPPGDSDEVLQGHELDANSQALKKMAKSELAVSSSENFQNQEANSSELSVNAKPLVESDVSFVESVFADALSSSGICSSASVSNEQLENASEEGKTTETCV